MPFDPKSPQQQWAEQATEALAAHGYGPVGWVQETGSTNTDLLDAAAGGAPAGRILVTDHQTAGRGRRDRTWVTAPGDALLVSILLRPALTLDSLATVLTAVGVAAADACRALGFDEVALKWPNDLVVGEPGRHRKLAGILAQVHQPGPGTEAFLAGQRPAVVVGMGLNVRSAGFANGAGLAETAIALDQCGPPPERLDLLIAVVERLAQWMRVLESPEPQPLWDRYRTLSATLGSRVRCQLEAGTVEGVATDVDPTGALLVDTGDQIRRITAGDVVSLRPAGA